MVRAMVQERTRISMMWSRSLMSERQSCRLLLDVQLEMVLRPSSTPLLLCAGNARTEMSEESYIDVSMSSKMSSNGKSVK